MTLCPECLPFTTYSHIQPTSTSTLILKPALHNEDRTSDFTRRCGRGGERYHLPLFIPVWARRHKLILALDQGPSIIDPSRYIPQSRHQFKTLYISKSKPEADIDDICRDDYNMVLNYMVRASESRERGYH